MIKKIMDTRVKVTLIICGTVLAAIAMITQTPIPDWVFRFGMMMFGG